MSPFGFTVLGFGSGSSGVAEAIPAGTKVTADDFTTVHAGYTPFEATGSKFYLCYNRGNEGWIQVCSHTGYAITKSAAQKMETSSVYSNSADIDRVTGNKGIMVYVRGNVSYGYYIYAKAFTVSGTTVTYGSQTVIHSEYCYSATVKADPLNADKYMATWRVAAAGGNHHKGCIITLSGTTISKGTTATIHSAGFAMSPSISWDPNTANILVCYIDAAGSPDAIACTISGTTVTAGTKANIIGAGHAEANNGLQFDPFNAGKCIITYRDNNDGNAGKVVEATISGTSISLGTPSEFKDSVQQSPVIAFDPNNEGKLVVVYADGGDDGLGGGGGTGDNVSCKIGTLTGGSFSWGDENVLDTNQDGDLRVIFDPDPEASGIFLATYADGNNSNYLTHVLCQMGL